MQKHINKLFLLLCLPCALMAATQGLQGETSTGSSDISITVAGQVKISHLHDIALGSYTGMETFTDKYDELCVYSNAENGAYTVEVTSSDGAFQLVNAASGHRIPYQLWWNDQAGTSLGEQVLNHGQMVTNLHGADTTDPSCGGGQNARLRIEVDPGNIEPVFAGRYVSTLTIVIGQPIV